MDYTSHMCSSICEEVILVNRGCDSFATMAKLGAIHSGAVTDSWPQTNFVVRKPQVWFDQFDISVMWVYLLISNDAWMNNTLVMLHLPHSRQMDGRSTLEAPRVKPASSVPLQFLTWGSMTHEQSLSRVKIWHNYFISQISGRTCYC